ncbi:MAG: outer membrane beta-barrel protein [Chitinophagia bacterium]
MLYQKFGFMSLFLLCSSVGAMSQQDSAFHRSDTLKVGGFVIITDGSVKNNTKNWSNYNSFNKISISRPAKKNKTTSTNWFIFDLGFANYRDQTNYTNAQAGNYLKIMRPGDAPINESSTTLNTGKSSNVNIWFFMQRVSLSKNVLNIKYGLGLEMYNFRYDSKISFRNAPAPMAFTDSIGFTKNKLYAGYITVPFMLNLNTKPGTRKGLILSAGMSAGYLLASRNKQISGERGKQKYRGDLALEPWRLAAIGEIGLGPVRLYGSYSLNTLQKSYTRMEQYPYTIGIRFSTW